MKSTLDTGFHLPRASLLRAAAPADGAPIATDNLDYDEQGIWRVRNIPEPSSIGITANILRTFTSLLDRDLPERFIVLDAGTFAGAIQVAGKPSLSVTTSPRNRQIHLHRWKFHRILPSMSLRIEILGPLRAWRDGAELDLGPTQQRCVLALLVLADGRPVRLQKLVDAIWGGPGSGQRRQRHPDLRQAAAPYS
ncbi:hypothetical protein GCM10018965_031540 [Nonomuraea roseola]